MRKGNRLLFGILCLVTSVAHAGIEIQLDSAPGDYVGGGALYSYSDANASISVTPYPDRIYMSVSAFEFWTLQFKTPQDLSKGPFFGALRYPSQGPKAPGLSVFGNGRGCNRLSGHFVIFELAILNNEIQQLALDFEQYCDGSTSPLRGSLRVNSSVPMPVEVPVAYAGGDKIVDEAAQVQLSAAQSYSALGLALSYNWQQVLGPGVVLQNPNAADTGFTAPANLDLGGVDLGFEVSVMDSNGISTSDTVWVHVQSKSDPKTFLKMNSEEGDYIGQGQTWFDDPISANFTLSSNFDNGVSARVIASSTWYLDFAPIQGNDLTPGIYLNASRFPFQAATDPGLSVSGYGRSCGSLTGEFEVLSVESVAGAPASFAANFEQHCGGAVPALFGTLAINYTDPSVPLSDAGADQLVQETDSVSLDGSNSSDSDGSIIAYVWTQLTGPLVTLNSASSVMPTFEAPTLAPGVEQASLTFELLVIDDLGFKAVSQVTVTVVPKPIPPVAVDDEFKVRRNTLGYLDVLANDTDNEALDVASIVIVDPPQHGIATVRADGIIEYLPDPYFRETDSFRYTVKDNDGLLSNTAKVTIEIVNRR